MIGDFNAPVFWSILIITTITVIIMIHLFFQPLPFPDKNKCDDDRVRTEEELNIINRIENNQLEWLSVTVFFITLAVILKRFEGRAIVTIFFVMTAWLALVVLGLDYIQSRINIAKSGHKVTWRMNFLFFISLAMMTIVSVILYDTLTDDYYKNIKKVKSIVNTKISSI